MYYYHDSKIWKKYCKNKYEQVWQPLLGEKHTNKNIVMQRKIIQTDGVNEVWSRTLLLKIRNISKKQSGRVGGICLFPVDTIHGLTHMLTS